MFLYLEDEENLALGHLNPDLYDFSEELPKAGFYKKIEIPDQEILKSSSRKLDEYQKEVLNITVKLNAVVRTGTLCDIDKNGCKITSFRYNIQITKICRLH